MTTELNLLLAAVQIGISAVALVFAGFCVRVGWETAGWLARRILPD